MTTGSSSGQTGRCDAKCYNAKGQKCDCCCGGRNHGVGIQKALQNSADYAQEMMKEWKDEHPEEKLIFEGVLF
jgi:hypothetical protein